MSKLRKAAGIFFQVKTADSRASSSTGEYQVGNFWEPWPSRGCSPQSALSKTFNQCPGISRAAIVPEELLSLRQTLNASIALHTSTHYTDYTVSLVEARLPGEPLTQ